MALSEIQKGFGATNMLSISYHTFIEGFETFANRYSTDRATMYGVNGIPVTLCDAVYRQDGTGSTHGDSMNFAGDYNSRHGVESPVAITISGTYHPSTLTGQVKALVTNTGTDTLRNQKLVYVIVESVPYRWYDVDTCWNVQRCMMPNAMGVDMSLAPGSTVTDSQGFILGMSWVESRIRFVVFLQNGSPGEIRQGAWVPLSSFTGVEMGTPIEPEKAPVALAQNRPNPFKGTSEIEFNLPTAGEVRLALYDAQGRLVRNLVEGTEPAGTHIVNVSNLGSGVYFYRLEAGNTSLTRRMVVTK